MIFSSWFELILCSIGFQHQYSGLLWHNDQKSEHSRQNKVLSFPSQRWSGIMVKNAALLNNSICLWRKHTWLFIPFFKGCVLRGIFLFSNSFLSKKSAINVFMCFSISPEKEIQDFFQVTYEFKYIPVLKLSHNTSIANKLILQIIQTLTLCLDSRSEKK